MAPDTGVEVAGPLISAGELRRSLEDPVLVIVDVRWYLGKPGAGRMAYSESHLPGAIFADLDDDLSDLGGYGTRGGHPLQSPAAFEARMAAVGIGDRSKVVAYDDVGGWVAARLWWMLDNLGFGRPPSSGSVRVLDGGIGGWIAAGHPLSTDVAQLRPAELHLANQGAGGFGRDALRSTLWAPGPPDAPG